MPSARGAGEVREEMASARRGDRGEEEEHGKKRRRKREKKKKKKRREDKGEGPGTQKKKEKELLVRWRGMIAKRRKEGRVAARRQG